MEKVEVRVSENISEANTLPSWLYTKPEVLEVENREIFSKTWQYVGHISQFNKPGDYITTEVANRPIIISYGKDEKIRAFYNVCSHRASRLVEGDGNKAVFTCPYHAWSFRLDGSLNRAPNMKGVQNFNEEEFCLKKIKLEIFQSFIFVNLNPNASSMSSQFPDLFKHVRQHDLGSLKKHVSRKRFANLTGKLEWIITLNVTIVPLFIKHLSP